MRQFLNGARQRWVWQVVTVVLFAVLAGRTGTDVNWDLRNYHSYNAHALLNGRFWTDIAPAQLQTFLSPLLDIPIGALRDWLNDRPTLLNAILSLPHGLAVCLTFELTLRVTPAELPGRAMLALGATLFGAAGAAGYPLLATTMDDALPASCIFGGLLLLVADSNRPVANAAYSGLLFGLAAGLKLTALHYCIAGVAASSLMPDVSPAHRLRPTIAFVLAGVLAAAVVGGPWWTMLFSRYQNPVLPFMNQWFSSPFVQPLPFTDERFKPVGLLHALTYPFFWAFKPSSFVAELPVRDPRFALTYLAVVGMVVHHSVGVLKGRRNLDRSGTALFVFFVTAFVLWELMFSILRYLAVLELLTGAMALLACQPLLAMQRARVPAILGLVAAGVGVQAMTIYPDWGRLPSPTPLLAELPAIEPGGMVVLLDPSPMAYLANLAPPAVRFIGANNNLIRPGGGGLLSHQAENAVRTHVGPLYGLEDPAEVPGIADRTLSFYRLAREGCRQVTSNLDNNVVRLCRLRPAVE